MALTVMHLVARLPHRSGLPEDIVEMTVNVRFPDEPSLLDRASAVDKYIQFFQFGSGAVSQAPDEYLSDALSRTANAAQILGYETTDLTGETPFGSPTASSSFTLGAALVGQELPEEVCACISYNADLTNVPVSESNPSPPPAIIRPQQRRRGRLYFGPLVAQAGGDTNNVYRPTTAFMTDIGLSFAFLADEIASATTGELAVWSRADADLYPVVGGYVDNAWDIQRRRGPDPSTRITFAV